LKEIKREKYTKINKEKRTKRPRKNKERNEKKIIDLVFGIDI
jgi:hypothetical protein